MATYHDYYADLQGEDNYKSKFNLAKSTVESNPISNVVEKLNSVYTEINGLSIVDWYDSAGESFNNIKFNLSSTLNNMITNISSVYVNAESLYKSTNELVIQLEEKQQEYLACKNDEPKKSDYYTFIVFDSSAYNSDKEKWEEKMAKYEKTCSTLYDNIKRAVSLLSQINGIDASARAGFDPTIKTLLEDIGIYQTDAQLQLEDAEFYASMIEKGYVHVTDPEEIKKLSEKYGVPYGDNSLIDPETGETHQLDFWYKEEDINDLDVPILVVLDSESERLGYGTKEEYVAKVEESIQFFRDTVPSNVLQRMQDTKALTGIKFDQTPFADHSSYLNGDQTGYSYYGGAYYNSSGYVAMHNCDLNFTKHAVSHELGHAFDQTLGREADSTTGCTGYYSIRDESGKYNPSNSTFATYTDDMKTFYEGLGFDGCTDFDSGDYNDARAGTLVDDSGRNISESRLESWQLEHFANSFRMYLEEPDKLKTVQPELYEYMDGLVTQK